MKFKYLVFIFGLSLSGGISVARSAEVDEILAGLKGNAAPAECAPDDGLRQSICEAKVDEVCNHVKKRSFASAASIKDEAFPKATWKRLLTQMSSKDGDSMIESYRQIIARVQAVINERFQALGVPPGYVIKELEIVRSSIIHQIGESALKSTSAKSTVESIQLVTPDNLPASRRDVLGYYSICGADGLEVNAAYSPDSNSFYICPGYLLKVLDQGGDLRSLDDVVAHEIGHSMDTSKYESWWRIFSKPYQSFLSCLTYAHIGDLNDPHAQAGLTKKYLDHVNACSERMKHDDTTSPDELVYLAQEIRFISNTLYYQKEQASFGTGYPLYVISHGRELSADLWGRAIMSSRGWQVPYPDRPEYVLNNISLFCDDKAEPDPVKVEVSRKCKPVEPTISDQERELLSDDGFHPRRKVRLEMIMNDAGVRAMLGCPAKPKSKVYPACTM
jgi:hypothetical protein